VTAALAREVASRVAALDGVVAVALGGLGPDPAVLQAALARAGALVGGVRDRCGGLLTEAAGPPSPS
jgi:hypothetical protein